jgi:drug/metabolite transporter (DMT)-like permease
MTSATAIPATVPSASASPGTNDLVLLVVPGVIWGASFLFIAEGLRAVGPHGVAFARIAAGFLTLAAFPAARQRIAAAAWPRIALLGVIWLAIPLTLFPYAEQRVSSALAGMLNGAVPLFVTAVATIIARKAPSRTVMLGLLVGLLGVALVALPQLGGSAATPGSATGVVLVFAALILYGISLNLARPLQMQYGALPVLVRALGVALVITAPLGLPEVLRAHWTPAPLFSLLALGSLGTGIAYVLGTIAAGRLGATRASASIFITAPVALMLGAAVLHEHVDRVSIIGAVVCILGALIIRREPAQTAVATRAG